MEIKVYVYWKESEKPEVRRFMPEFADFLLVKLHEQLQTICPNLQGKVYSLTWKDEDGDDVVIKTDGELAVALNAMQSGVKKFAIYVKDEKKVEDDDDNDIIITTTINSEIKPEHVGVVCDVCDRTIHGYRYKCTTCADYDLCSTCEANGNHPEHCMVRVPMPTMPRALVKAAIKRSRYFLKSVIGENGPETSECPYKNKRERSSDRKHRGHGHRAEGGHRPDRHRRNRASWLETFATYMNEFTNLAGDIDLNTTNQDQQQNAQQNKTQEQATQASSTQEKTNPQNVVPPNTPRDPTAGPSSDISIDCPFSGAGDMTMENIHKLFQMYMTGGLNNFMHPNSNNTTAGGNAQASAESAAQANTQTSTLADNDVEMSQADEESSASSVISEKVTDKGEGSPDRGDDWTVINKEKDLMDSYVRSDTREPLEPQIGFNLPERFQQQVTVSQLYPPLNAATAVLDPKIPEPEAAKAPQVSATPSAPPTSQTPPEPTVPQSRPVPKRLLLKPHVAAALEQMLAMGFTNDGGWLSQLLENKDGNIAAVLDLLTPVTPKKN